MQAGNDFKSGGQTDHLIQGRNNKGLQRKKIASPPNEWHNIPLSAWVVGHIIYGHCLRVLYSLKGHNVNWSFTLINKIFMMVLDLLLKEYKIIRKTFVLTEYSFHFIPGHLNLCIRFPGIQMEILSNIKES